MRGRIPSSGLDEVLGGNSLSSPVRGLVEVVGAGELFMVGPGVLRRKENGRDGAFGCSKPCACLGLLIEILRPKKLVFLGAAGLVAVGEIGKGG